MLDKKYNPQSLEQEIYSTWTDSSLFKTQVSDSSSRQHYALMLPPPNVTGSLHMGHAFQDTLMDALVRHHRLKGFSIGLSQSSYCGMGR